MPGVSDEPRVRSLRKYYNKKENAAFFLPSIILLTWARKPREAVVAGNAPPVHLLSLYCVQEI